MDVLQLLLPELAVAFVLSSVAVGLRLPLERLFCAPLEARAVCGVGSGGALSYNGRGEGNGWNATS